MWSVMWSLMWSVMWSVMWSLLQSLARELGPLGVHVAHVVVDGAVDNVNTRY